MAETLIKLGDFKDIESKTLAEREIFARIKPSVGTWAQRSYKMTIRAPYRTMTIRSVVFPKAPSPNECLLLEGIIPDAKGSLTVVERTLFTKPYGFYEEYTDEMVGFSFSDLVPELTASVANQGKGVVDNIAGEAWRNGNQVWTANSGLTTDLINQIRISLRKFTTDKSSEVFCVISPEDLADLRKKYNTGGSNLFEDTTLNEPSVKDAKLTKFQGVYFEEDYSPFMYGADGKRFAYFYVKDSNGRAPVAIISPDANVNGTFITKPLGSAGTEDPLDQKGSIGVKFKGLGAMIISEECLARVEISGSGITTVNSEYNYLTGTATANGTELAKKNQDGTAAKVESSPVILIGSITKTILEGAVGTTATVSAKDIKGSSVTGFTLTSSNTGVATVTGTTVKSVANGKTIITATKDGYAPWSIEVEVKITV